MKNCACAATCGVPRSNIGSTSQAEQQHKHLLQFIIIIIIPFVKCHNNNNNGLFDLAATAGLDNVKRLPWRGANMIQYLM